ncbi:MAG TPA: hypothetical protein VFG79_13560 [Solirubrobacter sp.]|nr:hypothetical protein [Solirubrobacter sp.]
MRVDWVHPSWRDLVIASLVEDAPARRAFLARCGVDGAAVALSRPLLRDDGDWDALGDGLYQLCADLGEPEAIRLLNVLDHAGLDDEVRALARMVLERLHWGGKALSVDAIAAWLRVAAKVTPHPEPPALAMTWLELEPDRVPATPTELERFADWLRLADLLDMHDPELLARLGFPTLHERVLAEFAEQSPSDEPVLERELRREALTRLAVLDDSLTALATGTAIRVDPPVAAGLLETPPPPRSHFPVERVLRDLI